MLLKGIFFVVLFAQAFCLDKVKWTDEHKSILKKVFRGKFDCGEIKFKINYPGGWMYGAKRSAKGENESWFSRIPFKLSYWNEIKANIIYKGFELHGVDQDSYLKWIQMEYLTLNFLKGLYLPANFDFFAFSDTSLKNEFYFFHLVKAIFDKSPGLILEDILKEGQPKEKESDHFPEKVPEKVLYMHELKDNFESLSKSQKDFPRIFLEIAKQLQGLHKVGIIYRNLSLFSVFMIGLKPMLIYFQVSFPKDQIPKDPNHRFHTRPRGSNDFIPEIIDGNSSFVDESYDWFTFGRFLMKFDFSFNKEKYYQKIPNFKSLDEAKSKFSDGNFADLVFQLTRPENKDRLDYKGIINHPYFEGVVTDAEKKDVENASQLTLTAEQQKAKMELDEFCKCILDPTYPFDPSKIQIPELNSNEIPELNSNEIPELKSNEIPELKSNEIPELKSHEPLERKILQSGKPKDLCCSRIAKFIYFVIGFVLVVGGICVFIWLRRRNQRNIQQE